MDHGERDYGKPSNFVFHYRCVWGQLLRFSTNILYLFGTSHLFFRSEFSKDLIFLAGISKNFYNSFDWLSVFCLCLKDHQNSLWILIRKENGITIFRTSGRILVEKEDSIGIFQGFQAGFTISNGLFWSEKLMVSPIGTSVWLCPQCLSRSTANIAFVISILGAKYLVYVSSCSIKMREFSFLSFCTFWGKRVYL